MAAQSSLFITQFTFLLILFLVSTGRSDFQSDRAECQNTLLGMASCIGYISVNSHAKIPTSDCCKGVVRVLEKDMKCLCILIKDRNEPMLGINYNITRSLNLPGYCRTHTNISECIDVLHVPTNSTEAKDFKQFADSSPSLSTPLTGKGNSTSTGGDDSNMESGMPETSSGRRSRLRAVQLVLVLVAAYVSCS